jgi:hypothetical protein
LGRSGLGTAGGGYVPAMTTDRAGAVHGPDLRRLLDSELPDPVLVLHEGRAEVVAANDRERAGLEIISRAELRRRAGRTSFTDAELEQHAAHLATAVNNLGG